LTHVGNDVVDLQTTDAIGKSGDAKFIQRVLGPDEQEMVFNSKHPDISLWAFWSAKETAYKAISKIFPDVSSAPRRYPVTLHEVEGSNTLFGDVNTPKGPLTVTISIDEDYIHCIGAVDYKNASDKVVWGVKKIDSDKKFETISLSKRESLSARSFAIDHMAVGLNLNPDDIHIDRNQFPCRYSPPIVFIKGKKENIDLSLSHDGRFVAFAYLMEF
jgi:phosphopantetheine--protein transferase-like protein